MDTAPRAMLEDLSQEPLEVRLVADVTSCRACDWFWRQPPYGPYPAFDFLTDFPEQVLARGRMAPPAEGQAAPWLDGRSVGDFVNPQILHGCRKAPIMTIGINPNLTAFWPGTEAAGWAYPRFSNYARYAYHYRHRTLYQESLDADFIRRHVDDADALKAEGAGYLKNVAFANDTRRWEITIAYDDGRLGDKTYTVAWDETRNFVLLYDRCFTPPEAPQFEADAVIAGFQAIPDDHEVGVLSNLVGYYQRFVPMLEILDSYYRALGKRPRLAMAEDVCQLDMVACASPGWGAKYEIDKQEVVANCVVDKAWAIKQLVQSNPKLIVFSGRSAYEMFHGVFPKMIVPTLDPTGREIYDLLASTCRWPYYLEIDEEVNGRPYRLRARVVVTPHFSYDDNFVPHTRFSPRAWGEFRATEPEAVEALEAEERILEPSRDGYIPVDIRDLGDVGLRFPGAVRHLLRNFYEPVQMIASALIQEAVMGNLTFDDAQGRLARADGSCHFCVNGAWQFPEGCVYEKPDEARQPDGFLEAVVAKAVATASAA